MTNRNTRRRKTQNKGIGLVLPDNAPVKGHFSTCRKLYNTGSNSQQPSLKTGCSYRNIVRQCLTYNGRQQGLRAGRGFTLIELLVVVLIIGILAAVVLPQYQKAVQKARFSEALVNIHTLQQAVDAYRLANGEPDDIIEDLTDVLTVEVSSANFRYTPMYDTMCNGFCWGMWADELEGHYRLESVYENNVWNTTCQGWDNKGEKICDVFNQMN